MKKRIKYGRLYWFPLKADDLGKFFLRRVFNKLGIMYIPFTLRFYDELYLREDRSKYSRRLINKCRKFGITTYVVQEGPINHGFAAKFSHLPLYADIFLCPVEDYELWIKEGMPKERIKTYNMQKYDKNDYGSVIFLEPLFTWNGHYDSSRFQRNIKVIEAVCDMLDKDVVFRPGDRYPELITPLLPPHRIVWGNAEELIKKYKKVYCFSDSSIIKDCQMLGKNCEIVDKTAIPKEKIINYSTQEKPKDHYDGIVFLSSFVTWDHLGFTWRRDNHNAKLLKGIYDMLNKDVVFKPHQANPELVTPYLPPHRIVWGNAEELIKKYKKVYCFSDSSIAKDCEMLGKDYEIVDKNGDR